MVVKELRRQLAALSDDDNVVVSVIMGKDDKTVTYDIPIDSVNVINGDVSVTCVWDEGEFTHSNV